MILETHTAVGVFQELLVFSAGGLTFQFDEKAALDWTSNPISSSVILARKAPKLLRSLYSLVFQYLSAHMQRVFLQVQRTIVRKLEAFSNAAA